MRFGKNLERDDFIVADLGRRNEPSCHRWYAVKCSPTGYGSFMGAAVFGTINQRLIATAPTYGIETTRRVVSVLT
jgi:hypothetical protein